MTAPKKTGYDANDFVALEGIDAIRKRPGMYVSGTGTKGMTHLAYEVLDNAVDEAIAGYCKRIEISLYPDGSVEISDDGRGIPVDINTKTGLTGVELAFLKTHAGGKFGSSGYKSAGGLHGVGAAVVNALSRRTDVTVYRNEEKHEMSFSRGIPGEFKTKADPDSEFTKKTGLRITGKGPKKFTGTTVRYWPDTAIFTPEAITDVAEIIDRARRTAFLVPGLAIQIRDFRESVKPVEETFKFDGGIKDMVDHNSSGTVLCDIVEILGTGTFLETVPVLDDKGHMHNTEIERTVEVSIAFRWGTGYESDVRSFVNVVSTPIGGTHNKGFERGLLASIRKGYEGTRLLTAKDDPVILEDALEGITAVISIGVPEPQFVGQTKEELGTQGVLKIVQDITAQGVKAWIEGKKKAQARIVLEKIANAAKNRVAARTQREAARRKTSLESASMPAKLVDCRATGVDRSEIFIVEGDSALGSARSARNSEYQALLPIRGKILNVQKASLAQVLANVECASIIQVVGAGSGRTFDLEAMRYGKIILMADADIDGSHIRVLLVTLFWKYMRPLIEAGRLYTAVAPLHKVETTGRGGDTVFTYSQAEMENLVNKLESEGKTIKKPIPRFKGLGEMSAEELWSTTMSPEVRTVRQITMGEAEQSEKTLELLMGNEVQPRREWLIANADKVDSSNIDS